MDKRKLVIQGSEMLAVRLSDSSSEAKLHNVKQQLKHKENEIKSLEQTIIITTSRI